MMTFGYHSCYADDLIRPRSTDGNIKGIELEISDSSVRDILQDLIDENYIIDESNISSAGSRDYTIIAEDDGSVWVELVFKACNNRTLLQGVKMLSEAFNGEVDNNHETSCHIHLNNRHLSSRGLTKTDIMKATEFLFPILGAISGRGGDYQWAKPMINLNMNMFERCRAIDDLDCDDYRYHEDRYYGCNVTNSETTEIRIFSNYYNFDYDYIKMYIETADFIIDLAEEMIGKSYHNNYELALEKAKEHFEKRKYKEFFETHDLGKFFLSPEEQRKRFYNEELKKFKTEYEQFIRYYIEDVPRQRQYSISNWKVFLRILRNYYREEYGRIQFDIRNFSYEEVFEQMINGMEEYISSL